MIFNHHQTCLAIATCQCGGNTVTLCTQSDQIDKVVRIACGSFAHFDPGVLSKLRSIDIRNWLIAQRTEETLESAQTQNTIVVLANFTFSNDFQLFGHASDKGRKQTTKALGER